MNETSQLMETINPDLLDESNLYSVIFVDSLSGKELEKDVKLKSPFDFDITGLVPTDQVTGLEEFFCLADQLIVDAQNREGVITSEQAVLKEDFNADEFHEYGDELITWRVIKREPANMDIKAKGRPQRRSLFDYSLRSPRHPNKVIVVESRPVDHIIEFSCWSKVAQLANKRALWLERLFIDHSWAFKVKGVERFYWIGRLADTILTTSGNRLHQRPLRFFVRFREFHTVAHPAIRNLIFEAKI